MGHSSGKAASLSTVTAAAASPALAVLEKGCLPYEILLARKGGSIPSPPADFALPSPCVNTWANGLFNQ